MLDHKMKTQIYKKMLDIQKKEQRGLSKDRLNPKNARPNQLAAPLRLNQNLL